MPHAFLFAHRPARVPLHCSKAAFATRGNARKAMGNFDQDCPDRARGQGRLSVYHCPLCGLWHIGHEPTRHDKEKRS